MLLNAFYEENNVFSLKDFSILCDLSFSLPCVITEQKLKSHFYRLRLFLVTDLLRGIRKCNLRSI